MDHPKRTSKPIIGRGILWLAAAVLFAGTAAVAISEFVPQPAHDQLPDLVENPVRMPPPDPSAWRAVPLQTGALAPDIELLDVRDGSTVSLEKFRGRPTVLLLSSFGCNVFCNELDRLVSLYRTHAGRVSFVFIAIRDAGHPDPKTSPPLSEPRPGESESETRTRQVREGAEHLQLPFPTLIDLDGKAETAYAAFPKRLVVVDADGRIVYDGGRGSAGGPSEWSIREVEDVLVQQIRRKPMN